METRTRPVRDAALLHPHTKTLAHLRDAQVVDGRTLSLIRLCSYTNDAIGHLRA
jgi:hypothetical protein